MYWILWFILALVVFKLYLKFSCGISKTDTVLVGRVAIVTGANTGIGFETAKDFAKRGARVILACRDERRGKDAVERIISATGANSVVYRNLDLASLQSVRDFASKVLADERRLDILVNNAGVAGFSNRTSEDGIMVEMQVNHFGPFLLTNLLLPLLKKSQPSRIVSVSSTGHWFGKINLDTIALPSKFSAYVNTKLCNILFTKELARRMRNAGWTVVANSLHPGAVNTDIFRHIWRPLLPASNWLMSQLFKTSWEGAQTTIHVSVSPETEEMSGRHFSDCGPAFTSPAARDSTLAKKLWELSVDLVKLAPDERLL